MPTGITIERHLPVFGYDDAPHGHMEIKLDNVRVNAEDAMLLGEGRGFEIAQGRLGPGRIHHCMRTVGPPEEALAKMAHRLQHRVAFGKRISEQSVWEQRIAEARIQIEMTRLLCLKAADMMDRVGNKAAQAEIAMIKVAGPAHGAADHRRRDPGARRRRRERRLRARQGLCRDPHAAARRRSRRSAQSQHRADRIRQARVSGTQAIRAAVLREPGKPLTIETIEIDAPGPHEVLIKTAACGVCRSDLHFVDGAFPHPLPTVPGHEASGIVEAVGSEVRTLAPGDHVVTFFTVFCGTCELCLRGKYTLCVDPSTRRAKDAAAAAEPGRRADRDLPQFVGLCAKDAGA